jgi:hypothetical protein
LERACDPEEPAKENHVWRLIFSLILPYIASHFRERERLPASQLRAQTWRRSPCETHFAAAQGFVTRASIANPSIETTGPAFFSQPRRWSGAPSPPAAGTASWAMCGPRRPQSPCVRLPEPPERPMLPKHRGDPGEDRTLEVRNLRSAQPARGGRDHLPRSSPGAPPGRFRRPGPAYDRANLKPLCLRRAEPTSSPSPDQESAAVCASEVDRRAGQIAFAESRVRGAAGNCLKRFSEESRDYASTRSRRFLMWETSRSMRSRRRLVAP